MNVHVLPERAGIAAFFVFVGWLSAPAPTLAHPDAGAAPATMSGATAHTAEMSATGGLRPYRPATDVEVGPSSPPANLLVSDDYRDIVQRMWQRSPTFRRQCARIAAQPKLTVTVGRGLVRPGASAITSLTRGPQGRDEASVVIGPTGSPVELVAHELEHIVEWLDGADYRSRDGVTAVVPGELVFETARAVQAGRLASAEVHAARP